MLLRRILPSRDRGVYFFIADNDILNDPHDIVYCKLTLRRPADLTKQASLIRSSWENKPHPKQLGKKKFMRILLGSVTLAP